MTWVRFRWDLQRLGALLPVPSGYAFRSAAKDEIDTVCRVVLLAYASDPVWHPHLSAIERRMVERIASTLGSPGVEYLVAVVGRSMVGVSGVATAHWTDQNLLTGICVLPGHQRKGLGRYLLAWSLQRLGELGLEHAQVYTELGSLADKKIYPMFGSVREEDVDYPGARKGDT